MAQLKSNKDLQVDAIISDMLEHVPEDKRGTYELILRRCQFYSVEDPMFPIVLFLLFFQDSICDNQEKVSEKLSDLEKILSESKGVELPKTDEPKKRRISGRVFAELLLGGILLFLSLFFYVKNINLEKDLSQQTPVYTETYSDAEDLGARLRHNLEKPDLDVSPVVPEERHFDYSWLVALCIALSGIGIMTLIYFSVRKMLNRVILPEQREQNGENESRFGNHRKMVSELGFSDNESIPVPEQAVEEQIEATKERFPEKSEEKILPKIQPESKVAPEVSGNWWESVLRDDEGFIHTDTGKKVTAAERALMQPQPQPQPQQKQQPEPQKTKDSVLKIFYPGEPKGEAYLPMQISFEKQPFFRCGMLNPTCVYLLTKYHAGDGLYDYTEARLVPSASFAGLGTISMKCNLLERAMLHHISRNFVCGPDNAFVRWTRDSFQANDIPIEPDEKLIWLDGQKDVPPLNGKIFNYMPDGFFFKMQNIRRSVRGFNGIEINR